MRQPRMAVRILFEGEGYEFNVSNELYVYQDDNSFDRYVEAERRLLDSGFKKVPHQWMDSMIDTYYHEGQDRIAVIDIVGVGNLAVH